MIMANSDLKEQERLSFNDFELETHFIGYWDKVIRQWLENDNNWKEMTAGESEEAKAAKEQHQVIEAINGTYEDPKYQINTIHMPEPYWGNPKECSIVLMNYNPAGGPRVNRHTTISCKDCKGCKPLTSEDKKIINPTTFIKYVNKNVNKKGYSHFAADESPVFKTKEELGADMKWFWDEDNGYEGYGWWQQKCGWLNHLVEIICDKKHEKRWPFAMELCGWHSKEWKTDLKWVEKCRPIIKERTILPQLKAMDNSLWDSPIKIAVCIGAGFSKKSLEKFFEDEKKDITFRDVTGAVFEKINNSEEIKEKIEKGNVKSEDGKSQYEDLNYTVSFEKGNIHVIANWKVEKKREKDNTPESEDKSEEKNRNYRIFNIKIKDSDKEKKYYILNTNYRGKNSHPGGHFWEFEKDLINAIKNL